MNLSDAKITFVGAGSMAEAIIRGLTGKHVARPDNIFVFNRQDAAKLDSIKSTYGVQITAEPAAKDEFVRQADVVVVAFKPKDAVEGLRGLRELLHPGQLLVSVIAGLSVDTIEHILATKQPIARTMPNTSSTIGLGATGLSFSTTVTETQRAIAREMFEATGLVSVVEESQLDIVTGVSGSGPAYIYYMMEAMIQGGMKGGLSEEAARQLTVQTVLGAANMVLHTGENPADLRRKVTSPNGTTQAAIETLDRNHFSEGVVQAVLRCAERAKEIGEGISESAGASVIPQTAKK
ncbi:pyrroline-5-carboxylate reductase [Paenibacillus thalictri]|uniref:Pyrroline-5-carboxylate reductase n=1 Tax=Paenibacillus thalictri TaxID=2527873 RepID=A0A4V2J4G4_9BACL|nr:pyrroline-5-carboxylate reductase [Paenibacillus thalictri]TBL79692.1 pyrroline-5-carboxylate reductase [Paenibacillus thalictri]